jgi:hypothetical protein
MNTLELQSKAQDYIAEMFHLHVKPEMEKWLKEHGFVRWIESMGGYVFFKENGEQITDDDFRESKDEEYKKFYKEYLDLIVYRYNRRNDSILYGNCDFV